MVKVAAYRTSDLKCHEVESVALKHEFLLEQRAFFNKHMKRDSYTILEITADRKSTRLNSSHSQQSRMPSSA